MRCAARFALAVVGLVVFPLLSWGQSPVQIPGPNQGYAITKSDSSQAAPAGYEGRTDNSTQTAVGNTPATNGKRIVTHFTLGNQIKTCPNSDGTAEGTGLFSLTIDSTDQQANGTSTLHIEMRANAKYSGLVSDDALLHDPVKADIDYSYNQTGTFRGAGGAITNSPPSNIVQHITIPIGVMKGMKPPDFGPFSGGDPTAGHYAEAFGVGAALAYWGGVYFSIAETKWTQAGQCAKLVFNPPSYTVQPVLGSQVRVEAQVQTNGGITVPGLFQGAQAYSGSGVDPSGGSSDMGTPMRFTYTAPTKKAANAGFGVGATSRAGVAEGQWKTGLGTDWSGMISCHREIRGDQGHDDLQTWSNYLVMDLTIEVHNGVATASGHGEVKSIAINKRKALRGGAITLIDDNSSTTSGTVDGSSPATVGVSINKADGTYSVGGGYSKPIVGKQHTSSCTANGGCQESDMVLGLECQTGADGTTGDPNHVSGSKSDVKTGVGRTHNGTMIWTLTWNLARQGTTQ
jgi:hypothetical protein